MGCDLDAIVEKYLYLHSELKDPAGWLRGPRTEPVGGAAAGVINEASRGIGEKMGIERSKSAQN